MSFSSITPRKITVIPKSLHPPRCIGCVLLLWACSGSTSGQPGADPLNPLFDPNGQLFGPATPAPVSIEDFFRDDPMATVCTPESNSMPVMQDPGGTPECPGDKNLEGCPCPKAGEQAPCWPGLRKHRGKGICQDGVTTCVAGGEFNIRWGPCVGAQLPQPGATAGAGACQCFSFGELKLDNISPCFISNSNGKIDAVSTFINGAGQPQCPTRLSSGSAVQPEPGKPWSTATLTVDCRGQFELCVAIKVGSVENPLPTDCVLGRSCISTWYGDQNSEVSLLPFPSWASPRGSDCPRRFQTEGGYAEMTVVGISEQCENVSENGAPRVFQRIGYCAQKCVDNPNLPDCANCRFGGQGTF